MEREECVERDTEGEAKRRRHQRGVKPQFRSLARGLEKRKGNEPMVEVE